MEIKLNTEEINFITAKLSQAPCGLVYEVMKLLEKKAIEASQPKEEEKKEE